MTKTYTQIYKVLQPLKRFNTRPLPVLLHYMLGVFTIMMPQYSHTTTSASSHKLRHKDIRLGEAKINSLNSAIRDYFSKCVPLENKIVDDNSLPFPQTLAVKIG